MKVSSIGAALAGGFIAICLAAPFALADEFAVSVVNKSEPELCAEKDNVNLEFTSPAVRSLRIQAVHPSYIGQIVVDRWAPDFTSCDMSHDPSFVAQARRVTFFENERFWLTGYTYPSFWRPATVPFKVGDRVEQGLHVVQLWVLHNERAEEVPGRLSSGWILACQAAAAGPYALERVWQLVPGRSGGGSGTAHRGPEGHILRS